MMNRPLHVLLVQVLLLSAAAAATAHTSNNKNNHDRPTTTTTKNNQDRRNLIINGEQAEQGRYPYFTTLDHECGGSLIAPDVVLTAGHCLPASLDSVKPRVGRYSYLNTTSTAYTILSMKRHSHWKRYGDDEFRHDVALLFLDRSPWNATNDGGDYIRLNRDPDLPVPQQPLLAMGVGWTSSDYTTAKKAMVLRQVPLEYLPNEQCSLSNNRRQDAPALVLDDRSDSQEEDFRDVEFTISYEGRIHRDHLCTTGGPHNSRDACAYDSGSPIIMVQGSGDHHQDTLVAMVSWGEGCADPNFPAVNARITDALDFITDTVCQYSRHPPMEFGCSTVDTMEETATTVPATPSASASASAAHHRSYSTTVIAGFGLVLLLVLFIRRILTNNNHRNNKGIVTSHPSEYTAVPEPSNGSPPPQKQWKMILDRGFSTAETVNLYQDSPDLSLASKVEGRRRRQEQRTYDSMSSSPSASPSPSQEYHDDNEQYLDNGAV